MLFESRVENCALAILATVALNDGPHAAEKAERNKTRESLTKILRVTKLNGEDHAKITDLRCMPISALAKIFLEKSEDKECFVYVCKYEYNYSCNTIFTHVKKNRISTVEHLIQCHLLDHLTKTKTGALIKLPKLVLTFEKAIPSILPSEPVVNVESKSEYEEVEWKAEQKKVADSVEIKSMNESSEAIPAEKPNVTEIDTSKRVETDKSNPEVSESSLNAANKSTEGCMLRRVKFDHPYSSVGESSSNIPVSSNKCAVIPIEYQIVDVNNLYYLNGESSSELNSFMIEETLNQSVSITATDGGQSSTENLPLVGCEAEVVTEAEVINDIVSNENAKSDERYFLCSQCEIVFSSKQVLFSHMKKKHSDPTMLKSCKGSRMNRNMNVELKTAKRRFEIVTEYRNSDLFEVVKENKGDSVGKRSKVEDTSILKTALLKESNKKPVINISNVWNNIHVQYV